MITALGSGENSRTGPSFRGWKEDGRLGTAADPDLLAPLLAAIVRGLAVLDRGGADRGALMEVVEGAIESFRPFLVEPATSQS